MIAGYAHVFGVPTAADEHGTRLMTTPGCFDLSGAINLCFGHDIGKAFASTADESLRLWQDGVGLAVEATPQAVPGALALVQGIARRDYRGLSPLFLADRKSHVETIDGDPVEVIERTRIGEVSIVVDGLCPGALCWLAAWRPEDMPAALAEARRQWWMGRPAHAGLMGEKEDTAA
jgi:phage head maturation protease